MNHSIFIFLLHFTVVLNLKGSFDSICYVHVRKQQTIEVGPNQVQTIYDIVPVKQCCSGYDLENDECIPRCNTTCKNGDCVKPNTCMCSTNYTGSSCDIQICPAGLQGPNCDQKCLWNRYGQNCEEKCACQNGDCDPVSGYCDCHQGWSGPDCSVKCPDDMLCMNDGVCNFDEEYCICPPGYTGQYCQEMCDPHFWGSNCSESCSCEDNYTCNPTNGECQYNCVNGEYYDNICWCDKGWTGDSCTEKLCPTGFYGENCDIVCLCKNSSTQICDRISGECICKPGSIGERCEETCPKMTFGQDCNNTCECIQDRHNGCDPISGLCNCKDGWAGETCNKECTCGDGKCDSYGNCICSPGWQGNNCQEKCGEGYYGEGCSDVCALSYDEGHFVCDYIRGPICAPGFKGMSCTEPCPEGTYGTDCQRCLCESYFICDRFTGGCGCPPGWYGTKCEIPCPLGSYGYRCDKSCKCPNCRPSDGYCACQPGWNTTICQEYCPIEYFDLSLNECVGNKGARTMNTFVKTRLLIISSVICLVMLILIGFVFWRRRSYIKRKSKRRSIEGNSNRPLVLHPTS